MDLPARVFLGIPGLLRQMPLLKAASKAKRPLQGGGEVGGRGRWASIAGRWPPLLPRASGAPAQQGRSSPATLYIQVLNYE